MKIWIESAKNSTGMYTTATLKHFCSLNHIEMANDIEDADCLWVSMCDPSDLPLLKKARKLAQGRPVVMGGFEAFFGVPYTAWADYVVVGEGWEFIEAWGKDPATAIDLPCVLKKGSNRDVIPSYFMPWGKMPIVKMPGKNRYYYMGGRGCKYKCKFCATSWVYPHTSNPYILKACNNLGKLGGKHSVTLVSNDAEEMLEHPFLKSNSIRAANYLENPEKYKAPLFHIGVEGWTEKARKLFGKPIKDDDLHRMCNLLKERKQQAEFFFIVDYPDWNMQDVEYFAEDVIPLDCGYTPKIFIKTTYFDPCPHTPYSKLPIEGRYCDTQKVFSIINSRNKRVRVFPTRSRARSAWRTALHRCTPEEAIRLGDEPKDTNTQDSFIAFKNALSAKGLIHLIEEQSENPCSQIKATFRI